MRSHLLTSRHRRLGCRGFTISELIVVGGIAMVLLAIVMPGLSRVHKSSVGVRCLGNMSQIAQATMAYAVAQGDALPYASPVWGSSEVLWNATVVKKNGIRCPANRDEPRVGSYLASISLWTNTKYLSGVSMPGVKVPDSLVTMSDIKYAAQKALALEAEPWHFNVVPGPREPDYKRHRANDRSNVLFVDGHAIAMDYTTFLDGFYPGMSKVVEAPYSAFWGTKDGFAGRDVPN